MRFAANIPTAAGSSEYSSLAFCDMIEQEAQRDFAQPSKRRDTIVSTFQSPDGWRRSDDECFTTLSALACETERVTLFPKTVNNELRHGPLLAKMAADFDDVSEGRLKLGMGAGWKEDEAVAYRYEWPDAPDRLRVVEETIELTKRLWTESEVSYDGDYYNLDGATCKPHLRQDSPRRMWLATEKSSLFASLPNTPTSGSTRDQPTSLSRNSTYSVRTARPTAPTPTKLTSRGSRGVSFAGLPKKSSAFSKKCLDFAIPMTRYRRTTTSWELQSS